MRLTKKQVIEEIKNEKYINFTEYCDDKEVMLEAVKMNGYFLRYASKRLRGDKEVVLEAVKQNGWILNYASEKLKDDKEVVLEAVKQNGWSLKYASEKLRNDKGLVLEAIEKDGWVLQFVSERLKKELLPQVLKSFDYMGNLDPLELVGCNGDFLALLTTEEQNSKEVVLEAIKQNKSSLVYAFKGIRNRIGDNEPVEFLKQWIKIEKQQEFLNQQLDKKENEGKIKI